MKTVFILGHTHELPKQDAKLIGVYESRDAAESAKERASGRPGFSAHLTGFEISEYEVGKDYWTEGFVTVIQSKK